LIPIEVFSGTSSFWWQFWVDYPNTLCFREFHQDSTGDGGATPPIDIPAPCTPDPSSCHVVQVFVALDFNDHFRHVPDQYGADSVTWLYDPSESGGCPVYDAGPFADGAVLDGGE